MSGYKEYRSKERITARVVERTIKIRHSLGASAEDDYQTVNAGDYEVLADDGTVSYQSKADFESANEPVRRERQVKQANTKGAKKKAATATNTPPAPPL